MDTFIMAGKSRTQVLTSGTFNTYAKDHNTVTTNINYRWETKKTEYLASEGHFWPPKRIKHGYAYDTGGGFQAISSSFEGGTHLRVERKWTDLVARVRSASGYWLPEAPTVLTPILPSMAVLKARGTTAFSRTVPNKPATDASIIAGELRQLPRITPEDAKAIIGKAHRFRNLQRTIGSGYLNIEFGWKPFVSSIRDLIKERHDVGRKVRQFERDSEKIVRRRYDFDETTSPPNTVVTSGISGFPIPSTVLGSGGVLTKSFRSTERIWFSAAYRYYVAPASKNLGLDRGLQLLNKLGGTITPSTLYNLAPWSWLLDYGTNAGDLIDNFTAFSRDNLVALHAYVMCTTTNEVECTLKDVLLSDGKRYSTTSKSVTTLKTRVAGNPYSGGFNGEPLTDKQLTILAALAGSRS